MEGSRYDEQSPGDGDETDQSADGQAAKRAQRRKAGIEAAEQLLGADVVALGMRITAELGGDDAPLLARWMALRIAELMRQAEDADDISAREKAARACADLVLLVWEARSNWPRGWPPESAEQVITALQERNRWQRAPLPEQDEEPSWWTALPAAFDSLKEEQELWRLVALADTDPSDIRTWLEQPGAVLGDDEKTQLERIVDAAGRANEDLTHMLTSNDRKRVQQQSEQDKPLTAEQRDQLAIRQMKQLSRGRLRLADRVAAARST